MLKQKLFPLFSIILLLAIVFYTVGCNPRQLPIIKDRLTEMDNVGTEETKEAIKNNAKLQELDNICKQIPLPEGFKLIAIQLSPNESPILTYYYYSENDFEKSDNYFRQYFVENGWSIVENKSLNRISSFRNDNYKINIQYGGMGANANYAINCSKLPSSK